MSAEAGARSRGLPPPDAPTAAPAASDPGLVEALPGLTRLAVTAWFRGTEWSVNVSLRAGARVMRAAVNGEPLGHLIDDAGSELRGWMRQVLGVVDLDGARVAAAPPQASDDGDDGAYPQTVDGVATRDLLRERGEELLRRSADVDEDDGAHPAFTRILGELAPDEARVLRFLAEHGPQPAVDVRTGGPLGALRSELVASGLSMIALEAGCRRPAKVKHHLDNLHRLGLIWFSRETLEDITRYHVLEAQPEVAEAVEEAGRGRTVRRTIHLTPFGEDFCVTCLPLNEDDEELIADARVVDPPADRPPRRS